MAVIQADGGRPDMSASLATLGKYEIRGVLGRGSAGTVYDAWDPIIRRRVAIKTVKLPTSDDPDTQDDLKRFRREAQAAGRLAQANIVPVFDYGETSEIAYIVMEYVGGGSLKKLMDQHKQVPPKECLRVMEQLLAGLQFSHDRGIIHRDIKPANVMLSDDSTVKITDFGIARMEGGAGSTMVGTMLGTPAYMSPEQWVGDALIDARSDIYASGVLLFHMLTGRRPFEGTNHAVIMSAVLRGDFQPPSAYVPGLSKAIDAVVLKAMATDSANRFASATEFAEALRLAVLNPDAAPVAVPKPAPTPAAAVPTPEAAAATVVRPARTGMAMTIGVVLAVAAGAGAAGVWFMTGSPKTATTQLAVAQPPPAVTPSVVLEAPADSAQGARPDPVPVQKPVMAPAAPTPSAATAVPPSVLAKAAPPPVVVSPTPPAPVAATAAPMPVPATAAAATPPVALPEQRTQLASLPSPARPAEPQKDTALATPAPEPPSEPARPPVEVVYIDPLKPQSVKTVRDTEAVKLLQAAMIRLGCGFLKPDGQAGDWTAGAFAQIAKAVNLREPMLLGGVIDLFEERVASRASYECRPPEPAHAPEVAAVRPAAPAPVAKPAVSQPVATAAVAPAPVAPPAVAPKPPAATTLFQDTNQEQEPKKRLRNLLRN